MIHERGPKALHTVGKITEQHLNLCLHINIVLFTMIRLLQFSKVIKIFRTRLLLLLFFWVSAAEHECNSSNLSKNYLRTLLNWKDTASSADGQPAGSSVRLNCAIYSSLTLYTTDESTDVLGREVHFPDCCSQPCALLRDP